MHFGPLGIYCLKIPQNGRFYNIVNFLDSKHSFIDGYSYAPYIMLKALYLLDQGQCGHQESS